MKYIVVLVTAAKKKEASDITENILNKKLAACVNILPGIHSFYWWKEKIEFSQEILLIIKTRKPLLKKLINEIKKHHSYEVPEIISLPVSGGNKDYLKWIGESTGKI